ncbi:MAG: AsmA family protein [Candidatus Omnitrophica bacterium]|nr:AsmA family protein [Candidatus Omnitrophota bacterium]
MKKIRNILIVVVISIFAVVIVRDQVIKSVITVAATQVLGAPIHINGFSLGVFNQSVRISGFKIYNPKGFSRGILVDLPKINVLYDLGALFKKEIHLVNVEIELKEMGLEKNSAGKLNIDALKAAKQERGKEDKSSKQMPMRLDTVKLGIGRIVLKDYSAGEEPAVKVYDININKTYKNITSAQQLAALILAEPMKSAGIEGAKIYGAAMLAGVAVLPVAVAATFIGRDSVQHEFIAGFDKVFETSSVVLKKMGRLTKEDKPNGILGAEIDSAQVALKIRKKPDNKTEVVISARKYLFPKPEIAGGVLYEISEKIK